MVAKPPKGVPLFPRAEVAVVWFSNEHSEFGLFSHGRSPVLKVLLISKTSIADWLTAFATPYPATPDFPLFRGQNKPQISIHDISITRHRAAKTSPSGGSGA